MDVFMGLIVLLVLAKLLGELVERAGYPALLGEVGAGIVLGPTLLNWIAFDSTIEIFSNIGIIVLLFLSGTELSLKFFLEARYAAASAAAGGVVIPFLLGLALGYLFSFPILETLCIAIALSITSIGISVRTLIDFRKLHTLMGSTIVGAAMLDDIIGIVLLGTLLSLTFQGTVDLGAEAIALLLAFVFLLFMLTAGKQILRWILAQSRKSALHEMTFSSSILIALGTAYIAHLLGLHFAIGAFLAGLVLGDQIRDDRMLLDSIADFSFGFFVTIFFASVGLLVQFQWELLLSSFTLPLILVAFLGKVIGGYLGSLPFLRDHGSSLIVGLGLTPRGEIALVVIKVALVAGILTAALYSILTLMVVVTILVVPVLMKQAILLEERSRTGVLPDSGPGQTREPVHR
jgi:Kef-type K+ transport system membrane component KefB